jgi:hypothetical protein
MKIQFIFIVSLVFLFTACSKNKEIEKKKVEEKKEKASVKKLYSCDKTVDIAIKCFGLQPTKKPFVVKVCKRDRKSGKSKSADACVLKHGGDCKKLKACLIANTKIGKKSSK